MGRITLTRVADRELLMSYELEGLSGGERLRWIDPGACPNVGGAPLRASGHWYPPAASGIGFDLVVSVNDRVAALYLYDGEGAPRWLWAQGSAGSEEYRLVQYRGFCRDCAWQRIHGRDAGTMRLILGAGGGQWRFQGAFLAPLEGALARELAVAPLTEPAPCP
ncbi:MAG: hypothetical protein RML12_08075 [Xanthomonadales bacterium]|nr:hypothetical protein [Xanthomonadales bacterium]